MKNITGAFSIGFFLFGIVFSVWAIMTTSVDKNKSDIKNIISGSWAHSYEQLYNKEIKTFDVSKKLWGMLNYLSFKEGRDGVLIGENGWLFTNEEFAKQPNSDTNYNYNINYIRHIHKILKKNNIRLFVIPIPSKARLYQDNLGRYKYPDYKKLIYNNFKNDLTALNIEHINSLSLAQKKFLNNDKKFFLKTDTHWTPEGAKMTAQQVAEKLKINNAEHFVNIKQKNDTYVGDLTNYIPVYSISNIDADLKDNIARYETDKQQSGSDNNNMSALLFEDSIPSITLVGTSYSANKDWNFEGFLKESLKSDILNMADEGLGPFETILIMIYTKVISLNWSCGKYLKDT